MSEKKQPIYIFNKPVEDKKTGEWIVEVRDTDNNPVKTIKRSSELAAKRYIDRQVKLQEKGKSRIQSKKSQGKKSNKTEQNEQSISLVEEDKKRRDWEYNHQVIEQAFLDLIEQNERVPTIQAVADKAGFSYPIVHAHLENLDLEPQKQSLRVLTPKIILSIAQSAMDGSAASQKLWMQMMEGFSEKMQHAIEGKIELSVELSLKKTLKLEMTRNMSVIDLVISRVCNKIGMDPKRLMYRLQNSFYSKFSGMEGTDDINKEELVYPSSVVYNFDHIRKKNAERMRKEKEVIEEAEIVVDEKAIKAKELLLAKIKKNEGSKGKS